MCFLRQVLNDKRISSGSVLWTFATQSVASGPAASAHQRPPGTSQDVSPTAGPATPHLPFSKIPRDSRALDRWGSTASHPCLVFPSTPQPILFPAQHLLTRRPNFWCIAAAFLIAADSGRSIPYFFGITFENIFFQKRTFWKRYLYPYVHCSVICNGQDAETMSVSISG